MEDSKDRKNENRACCHTDIWRALTLLVACLLIAGGMIYAGCEIRQGMREFRKGDRYVTVKGLATRDVKANLAIWPLSQSVTGDDLGAAQTALDDGGNKILTFLKAWEIMPEEVELQQVIVTDLLAQSYRPEGAQQNRYILTQTYLVRSENVDAIAKAAQQVGQLVKQGVVLSQNSSPGPTYLFTQINDVKPDMIAEATRNAREAAAQFASDSGQKIGDIRNASQGLFQILPRDETYVIPENSQINKTVRVVSTIDFYLE